MKNMAGIMLLPVFMTPCFAAPPHWCIHSVRLENRPLMLEKTTAKDIAKAFGHAAEFDASDSAPPSVCYRSERVFPTFSFQPGGRPMRLREVSISVLPPVQGTRIFAVPCRKMRRCGWMGKP